jgi:prephenate dehydratase
MAPNNPQRISYLGPPGTFTEEAASIYAPAAKLIPFSSNAAVADAVRAGMTEQGVLAIENSLEGSVPDTLDLLIEETTLRIFRELVIPIEHALMTLPGTAPEEIRAIYSHPNALGQCRQFLERCFPKAQAVAALSTAAAVQGLQASPEPAAAIAPARAAAIYGVQILGRGIQDHSNNATRFVVLALNDSQPTGNDKTSLCFSFDQDRPGLLYKAMGVFALRDINLVKVESRPTKKSLGRYTFLVDLQGHRDDPEVQEALEILCEDASTLKVLGSYPQFDNSQ